GDAFIELRVVELIASEGGSQLVGGGLDLKKAAGCTPEFELFFVESEMHGLSIDGGSFEEGGALTAAIDPHARAAHIAGAVGGEKEGEISDIVGGRETSKRNRLRDGRDSVFPAIMKMALLGFDHPGRDVVDAHLGSPFDGEALREARDSGLCCTIRRRAGRGTRCAHAADVHDYASLFLALHDGVRLLREVERGDEVQREDFFVERWLRIGGEDEGCTACVVHEDVEAAAYRERRLDDGVDRVELTNVRSNEDRLFPVHLRERLGRASTADHHIGALA